MAVYVMRVVQPPISQVTMICPCKTHGSGHRAESPIWQSLLASFRLFRGATCGEPSSKMPECHGQHRYLQQKSSCFSLFLLWRSQAAVL